MDARYGLAELVLRLVEETACGPVEAEFAIDEGVDLGGFDGRVRAEAGSRWVPVGGSVWELSVRRDVGTKADQDYEGRVAAPPGWSMPETVYSAVSLRAWRDRHAWAETRTAERRWGRVQALGLDDIMSWLSVAPLTEFWLAEGLGLHPGELEPAARWWRRHQDRTGGLFNCAVVLSGRGDAAEDLGRCIGDGSGPVIVEATSVGEALEFVAAVGMSEERSTGTDPLMDRMVFVTGPNAWRRLLAEEGPTLVLVATDPEFGVDLASTPHAVIIPVGTHGGHVAARPAPGSSRVVVPRLDSGEVAEALDCAAARGRGIDFHRAQELGALGRRSASALRRHLSVDPVIRSPLWARTDTSGSVATRRAKTAALLAGGWTTQDAGQEGTGGDRAALVELAGENLDYETVGGELRALTRGEDPLLSVSGLTWRLVNPQEAWQLLSDHLLTADVLSRFVRVASIVLSERDPLAAMSGVERLTAQVRGVGRVYSQHLRHGLARTLALLSTLGHDLSVVRPTRAVALARHCVDQLLRGDAEDDSASTVEKVRRLADLGAVLPLLAEAAPVEFVSAVDSTLRSPSEAGGLWFTDTGGDSIVGAMSSPHTSLLFALETLAWLPDHLADVADLLLRLEVADPGGRLANRPSSSFSGIFSIWAPQASASHQDRLEVLTGLRDRLVDQAASPTQLSAMIRLLSGLIPRRGSVVIPGARPQIRDYQLPQVRRAREVVYEQVELISGLILSLVEYRIRERREAEGMLDVLDASGGITTATSLSPSARDRLWTLFEEAITMFAPEELITIGQRLTGLARLHHNNPDADWALPVEETDRIACIGEEVAAAQSASSVPVEGHVWLFERWSPPLGPEYSPRDDFAAYDQELAERRATAVGEVIRSEGLNGLYRLAAQARANPHAAPIGVIGVALEEVELQAETETASPSLPAEDIETPLLRALDLSVRDTTASVDEKNGAQIAHGYFGARFRRKEQAEGDGWVWLGQLLSAGDLSAIQEARLIELTRDHPRAWQEAEALGPATLDAYWKLVNWHGLGSDFEHVEDMVRGLLSVGRAGAAAALLTMYDSDTQLEPDRRFELAVDTLEALDPNDSSQMAELVHPQQITEKLDFLAQHRPLTAENLNEPLMQRLTQLEIMYAPIRDPDEARPFIHNRMALDPSTFVDLVCFAYRPASVRSQDHDPYADMSPEQRGQRADQAKAAWRVLRSWRQPPGLHREGLVNYEELRGWMHEAQGLLDQGDRRRIGDEHIGRVLSMAPPDPTDGIAPPIAIRRLLEERQTRQFEMGLAMGLQSGPTGIRGGLVTEQVAKSLQAQEQATSDAEKVASRWPRTARLLRMVADSHGHDVSLWQTDQ